MGSGRNTVPLFDLLTNRANVPSDPANPKPTVRIDLQPAGTPAPARRDPIYKEPGATPSTPAATPPPPAPQTGARFNGPLVEASDDLDTTVTLTSAPAIEVEAKPSAATTPVRKPLPIMGSYERPQQPSRKPLIWIAVGILLTVGIVGYVVGVQVSQWRAGQTPKPDTNTALATPQVSPNTPRNLSDALSNTPNTPAKPIAIQQGTPQPTPKTDITAAPLSLLPTNLFTSSDPKVLVTASLTARGLLADDPRIVDHNYLVVVSLRRPDAESAVKFLTANGLESFAVPVDARDSLAKNLDPAKSIFRVYLAQSFSSSEYREQQKIRDKMQQNVARLGAIWQKELKGPSNLGQTTWEKYKAGR